MPELPEVETTCRGIRPHLVGQMITAVEIRQEKLRWPVSAEINRLGGSMVHKITRRAKYILINCGSGWCIVHLGMSGSMRLCAPEIEWRKHDHLALTLSSGMQLRYHDPRRFGCWLWTPSVPDEHSLLKELGPEPLDAYFSGKVLSGACKGRKTSIKQVIMDSKTVVGVGNIYACEALFMAGINPHSQAGTVPRKKLEMLAESIKSVLQQSIEQGGTTLRDFLRQDDQPGYFKQKLTVYGREGELCRTCRTPISRTVLSQRSTFFCPVCQPKPAAKPID